MRHLGDDLIRERLWQIREIGIDFANIDIVKEPIPILPGMHYIMGGIKTDVEGRTPLPGLYAAGETACVSVHGANRLGANSLLDTIIFGRRSGEDAAVRARKPTTCRCRRALAETAEQRAAGPPRPAAERRPHRQDPPRHGQDDERRRSRSSARRTSSSRRSKT